MTTSSPATAVRAFAVLRRGLDGFRMASQGYWSYPALTWTNKRPLWLFVVLGTVPLPKHKRTALFRPRAILVTLANSNTVVQYSDLRLGHDPFPSLRWEDPIAMFPHVSIRDLSYRELEKREVELLSLYPLATEHMAESGKLPPDFIRQYMGLTHPIFLPFIRHLAPAFFNALETAP